MRAKEKGSRHARRPGADEDQPIDACLDGFFRMAHADDIMEDQPPQECTRGTIWAGAERLVMTIGTLYSRKDRDRPPAYRWTRE